MKPEPTFVSETIHKSFWPTNCSESQHTLQIVRSVVMKVQHLTYMPKTERSDSTHLLDVKYSHRIHNDKRNVKNTDCGVVTSTHSRNLDYLENCITSWSRIIWIGRSNFFGLWLCFKLQYGKHCYNLTFKHGNYCRVSFSATTYMYVNTVHKFRGHTCNTILLHRSWLSLW